MSKRLAVRTALAIAAATAVPAFACTMTKDARLNYFSAYETGVQRIFIEGNIRAQRPSLVDRCQASAGRFLMLTLALRSTKINSDVRDKSHDGQLVDDGCRLRDAPLAADPGFEARKSFFGEQFRTLRACTRVQVTELNGRPLVYPEDQKTCRVKRLGPDKIELEGDLCFLEILPYYNLAVATAQVEGCARRETLRAGGLHPKDIDASLDVYVAADASGLSTDLDQIGSTRVRYSLLPGSDLLSLSDDLGTEAPRWPSVYTTELHQGPISLRPLGEGRTQLNLGLIGANEMATRCQAGLCTSPADFFQTVAGEVEFAEILPSGKREFLDTWSYGNSIAPRWRGVLRGHTHILEGLDLRPGRRYEVSVDVIDPTEDYQIFLSGVQQMLIDLKSVLGTAGLDVIAPLNVISDLVPLQAIAALPQLSGGDIETELQKAIERLYNFTPPQHWPPYYESVCEASSGRCRVTGKDKSLLKLTTSFRVRGVGDDGTYQLDDFRMQRASKYFRTYDRRGALPSVECAPRSSR